MALILTPRRVDGHHFRDEDDACSICGLKRSEWVYMTVQCPGKGTTGWLSS